MVRPDSTIPLVWPRSGASGRELANALRHVLNKAMNVGAQRPHLDEWRERE
jgi:hypothetical protein